MSLKAIEKKATPFQKFMRSVENVGNKLPHPFNLFLIFILITMVLSFILAKAGVSVRFMDATKQGTIEKVISVKNLLSYDVMRGFLSNFTKTYINFPPLGIVMIMMMGVGMLEHTGFMSALMRNTIMGAPSFLITAVLAFVSVNANLLSSAGSIFSLTIGGALYKALGRNPRIGIIVGFAAASGGYAANIFVSGTDALLCGITETAMKGVEAASKQHMHPMVNWYFLFVATFVLTFVIAFVTEKFVVKAIGENDSKQDESELAQYKVTDEEKRGLKWSGIVFLIFVITILALTIPPHSFFRNKVGKLLPKSPLMSAIVPIIFFMFASLGIPYGIVTKVIKSERDIPKLLQQGLKHSIPFLVVAFASSMFLALLQESEIATILAVKGGDLIKNSNIGSVPLIIALVLITSVINLFMTSGSEKWMILAPIFIPMFSIAGISPAMTQLAYRVGDTATNIISPVHSAIPIIIGLFEYYGKKDDEEIGFGSVISLTIPYAIAILITLTSLLVIWYLLGLPLGPGASANL